MAVRAAGFALRPPRARRRLRDPAPGRPPPGRGRARPGRLARRCTCGSRWSRRARRRPPRRSAPRGGAVLWVTGADLRERAARARAPARRRPLRGDPDALPGARPAFEVAGCTRLSRRARRAGGWRHERAARPTPAPATVGAPPGTRRRGPRRRGAARLAPSAALRVRRARRVRSGALGAAGRGRPGGSHAAGGPHGRRRRCRAGAARPAAAPAAAHLGARRAGGGRHAPARPHGRRAAAAGCCCPRTGTS